MASLLPKEFDRLAALWEGKQGGLEDELFIYDYFRSEAKYSPDRPLVLTLAGGLVAFLRMDGLDPETFGGPVYEEASDAIRRAMDNFSQARIEQEFQGGSWEIVNTLERIPARVPSLAKPEVPSEAIDYLWRRTNEFWNKRTAFQDELVWAIHFLPKIKSETNLLALRSADAYVELINRELNDLAQMVRRTVRTFEEDLIAFQTRRPKMGFGLSWMGENDIKRYLMRRLNHRFDLDSPVDPDIPLVSQVALSRRKNGLGKKYFVDDQYCAAITFKRAPKRSVANAYMGILNNCFFPFTLCNIFQSIDEAKHAKHLQRNIGFATGLARTSATAAEWKNEADEFQASLMIDAATPFQWQFTALVLGADQQEHADRVSKLTSWLKQIQGAQPMEEGRETRVIAELGTIPGNGFINKRRNLITSKNTGDLGLAWRLHNGSTKPHIFFGDRQGGYYGFDLFDPRLPNWNCACLGGPGSGKSILMNQITLGISGYPSQVYVIDMGNSFGTIFQFFQDANPEQVAIMRIEGGEFSFNPIPMAQALLDREAQVAVGMYKMVLEDGSQIPCPVEMARDLFTGWLKVLVGQGRTLTPDETYKLDRALQGKDGESGFFLQYESLCQSYNETTAKHPEMEVQPPEPLTELIKFLRSEAPEFMPAVQLWTRGKDKKFFDSGADSLSKAKMVYFELSGLKTKPELVRPFIAALMTAMWRRITNPFNIREKKVVIVDEGWAFLAEPAFASVIDEINRTIRKFNGFLVVSSQTPDEIKKGDNIRFLRNMSHQFIYKGFFDAEYFYEHLQMSKEQVELLGNLRQDDKVREVLHWDQNGYTRALEVVIDPYRYWYVTTNGDDKGYRSRFVRHFGGITAGVEALVEACDGRTIPSAALRSKLIEDYIRGHQVS